MQASMPLDNNPAVSMLLVIPNNEDSAKDAPRNTATAILA